jgi:ribonuclease P protein component
VLKKEFRLKSHSAFMATYNQNQSINGALIVLRAGIKKTQEAEHCRTRIGFIVSKKIHKSAVKRNRIKRLMRESLRLIIKNNEQKQLHNYLSLIFIAKKNALEKDFKEINSCIADVLSKLS